MIDPVTEKATRCWMSALPAVSAFVASQIQDRGQHEDILQETAVAVLKSFERYDPKVPFKHWAIGIARNQIRNYFRGRQTKPLVFDSETVESLAVAFDTASNNTLGTLVFLKECIATLQEKARHICELRYSDNLKPAAIAEELNTSPNNISKTLQRIRATLRDCIIQKAQLEGGNE